MSRGYFCDFNVYTGKSPPSEGEELGDFGLGEWVVLELTVSKGWKLSQL